MYDLIRKVLGLKTVDQKYHKYYIATEKLRNIDNQLGQMSREFTAKNELHKSICAEDLYENEVKTRVREKFAIFLKSYSESLSDILDQKEQLEDSKRQLEQDNVLIFADLKKALLSGALSSDFFINTLNNIEKAKNPKHKVAKVMQEYKDGKLQSSTGEKVNSRDQAVAIAMSEAGINKGDIPLTDECWQGDAAPKVKEMAITKGEEEKPHFPGETKKEHDEHEDKETKEEEKKEHEPGGYEEKKAGSKEEFKEKELNKGEQIDIGHLKDMVAEHERLIPLLDRFSTDPEVAKELATQKKELERYSGMLGDAEEKSITKAEYYHPEGTTETNQGEEAEDNDFLNKYTCKGFNVNKSLEITSLDFEMSEEGDINKAEYQGKQVQLGKPTSGDTKKFKVYVKNDQGNVIKVEFGDPNMEIKRDNPDRQRSFRARHKCDQKKDRTSAGYWSCKMWSKKPVSEITKALTLIEKARDVGEIDEFEYCSWIEKAKAGTYADNEANRKLGRAGEKYGNKDDEDEDDKKKPTPKKDEKKPKEVEGGKPESAPREKEEKEEKVKTPKVNGLASSNPRIKKLLSQAQKTSKQNLEAAVKQSDDDELRRVAQQELSRRKIEEDVSQ